MTPSKQPFKALLVACITSTIFSSVLLYPVATFITLTPRVSQWPTIIRIIYGLLWLILTVILFVGMQEEDKVTDDAIEKENMIVD